jgi:small subunit ribosomal protein S1
MGKKKIYGDLRYLNPDLFETEILTKESYLEERERLKSLYENCEIKIPQSGQMTEVVFVGLSQGYFNFEGGFKDFVRIEDKPNEAAYLKNIQIGDVLDVLIIEVDEDNFFIKASFVELYEGIARQNLISLEEGSAVNCFVRELTPAGYFVDIHFEGVVLPGFMPNTLAGINKLHDAESIVNQTFYVMIESYSKEEGTYIVSRRKYLQSLVPQEIKKLEHGKIYVGHVTGTTDFGVFVEFNGCLTGMVHKTNMNPELGISISQIRAGLTIEFYIKEIIKDKIILTQILRETLWDTIKVGQSLGGKVKDLKTFGALVILDDETNGLIHSSELEKSDKKISNGQEVKVKVIAVDRGNRKIFLSLM